MKAVSRRKVISTLATGGASLALAGFLHPDEAGAQTTGPAAKAFQGQHAPKPLPFDPAQRADGLSSVGARYVRTRVSHGLWRCGGGRK